MNHTSTTMSDESSSGSNSNSTSTSSNSRTVNSNRHRNTPSNSSTSSTASNHQAVRQTTTTTVTTTTTTTARTVATDEPSHTATSLAAAATAAATSTSASSSSSTTTPTALAAVAAPAAAVAAAAPVNRDQDADHCPPPPASTATGQPHPRPPTADRMSAAASDTSAGDAAANRRRLSPPDSGLTASTSAATAADLADISGLMRSGCIAHQRRLSSVTSSESSGGGGVGGGGGSSNNGDPATDTVTAGGSSSGDHDGTAAEADDYAYARACGGGSDANAWARLTEQQLRDLVAEMAKKMEYTERMNWLCLSSRPKGPPHRKTSLPNHKEVKARFLQICDQTLSDEIKAALRLPTFDSYEWSDEAVLHLMQTMFVDCGFVEKFSIPLPVLREWLYEVYKHYNLVPFHNFRHCFCVAQMMYSMAWHTNLMARLGDLEVLVLLVSCICHDLDHPGYNNIYQINARTELAIRYNDISPLENHHCSIAFRLLEHPDCNIFQNFDKETFREIREGIIRCILATDMARHNDILANFQEHLPNFDYNNQAHVNVFCMILIKVADISNESRPMNIAEPWLERLFQEFFAQSAIEKAEGLPVTPFMDPDKVSKPGSQVRFIGLVLLPLFEALGELLPELNELIIHPVRVAYDYYKCLNDAQIRPRKSHCDVDDSSDGAGSAGTSSAAATLVNSASPSAGGGTPLSAGSVTTAAAAAGAGGGATAASGSGQPAVGGGSGGGGGGGGSQLPRSHSGVSLKSRRSMPSQKSMSKNSVDEPMCISAELHDLPEGSESGDSETATEVEVAEKTSKFKINSEGNTNRFLLSGSGGAGNMGHSNAALAVQSGNNNNKCSRKESRRKRPSMISDMYTSSLGGGKARGSYGNIHSHHAYSGRCHFGSNRALSLDQYNSRRLSDGVPSIIADENSICFNRQHRSLDNEVIGSHCSEKYMSSDSCANSGGGGGGGSAHKVQPMGGGCCHSKSSSGGSGGGGGGSGGGGGGGSGAAGSRPASVVVLKNGSSSGNGGGSGNGATGSIGSSGKNGTSRSFMSTLRQLKESFHFSFEKDIKKRISGASGRASDAGGGGGGGGSSSAAALTPRNNNPEFIKSSGTYCCHAGAMAAAAAAAAADTGPEACMPTRTRACSLDVPPRMWYNGNNGNAAGGGGGGAMLPGDTTSSRKSSSHDDNTNSNRTLSDPLQPHLRSGSVGGGVGGGSSLDGDGNRSDGTTSI